MVVYVDSISVPQRLLAAGIPFVTAEEQAETQKTGVCRVGSMKGESSRSVPRFLLREQNVV